ncbi:MAG: sulfatase-like hydrolase/transferase [Acaryochloridaceae cyanobacterium RL_2_7]|nr:sulfatase-like hydrolase/transferase [Acaryochloridaceae cyanobacterium RL_2_7]
MATVSLSDTMYFSRRNFILGTTSLLTALAYAQRSESMTGSHPNIILIMADDVGYEAFGAYGSTFYQTPRLDALAAEGITFNHAYGTHLCTPSRVQIMTGKYNHRNYIRFSSLPDGERTFAQELKDAGYVTAVAGKWQLNAGGASQSQLPIEAGFDEYCVSPAPTAADGTRTGGGFYWFPSVNINNTWVTTTANDYGPDIFTNFINDFITRHQTQPFFAYYPMHLPHTPFDATPDSIDTSLRNDPSVFPDMMTYLDKLIGRIIDNLEALGLRENTIIIFTSDNGTNQAITSPLNGESIQGGKAQLTDAGTRLPFIASWQGMTPPDTTTNQIIDFSDVYPTLADLGGVDPNSLNSLDGQLQAYFDWQSWQ